MNQNEIEKIVARCKQELDLANAKPRGESLQSLPLCIIEAVFSINSIYTATENTVKRFCQHFNLPFRDKEKRPPIANQFSVLDLLEEYRQYGAQYLAEHIYENRQRTSPQNGILKSEAVMQFSETCRRFDLNYLQDIDRAWDCTAFEADIKMIKGQKSGVSLKYFYMLAGNDDLVKPERMVRRFIRDATGRYPTVEDAYAGIIAAQRLLVEKYPQLTPKLLDNLIWRYQRSR